MPLICAICERESSVNARVYSLPSVLHDLRQSCDRLHLTPPVPGSYAHPACVIDLTKKIQRRNLRRVIDPQTWRRT